MVDTKEMMLESQAAQIALEAQARPGAETVEDPFKSVADKRARKILKKHKREIDRLKQHAQDCLYNLNREGYIYAIGKIRTIIRKPLDHDTLGALYDTSVERIIELAKESMKDNKEG